MYTADARSWSGSSHAPAHLPTSFHLYGGSFNFSTYKPKEIGCVSITARGCFPNDARNKRYLRTDATWLSNVKFDLMRGFYDKYIRAKARRNERKLNYTLAWCLENVPQLQAAAGWRAASPVRPLDYDFVARRGHLAKVLVTPHTKNSWQLAVTLFRGTYFLLEERDDDETSEAAERINYIGHKFEHYMTSAKPGQTPNPSEVLDGNEAFYSVTKASLKSHSLLFSAEVDSEDTSVHPQEAPACYVELKTSPLRGDAGNVSSIKKLGWWAQSFLGGVPRILVGFKMDESTVVKCRMFNVTQAGLTQTAPMAWETPDYWKTDVCMNFLDAFLSFVKRVVTEDNHEVVYVFSWNLHDDVRYSIKRGRQHCFLLPEYVQRVLTHFR